MTTRDGAATAAVLDVNLGGGSTTQPMAERLAGLGVRFVFATEESRLADEPRFHGRPW